MIMFGMNVSTGLCFVMGTNEQRIAIFQANEQQGGGG